MMNRLSKYKKYISIFFVIMMSALCVIVFCSFVTAPYTGDIEVFMAAANQAKYKTGNAVMRVFEAWELKGIFNRMTIYIVYFLTNIFVKYTNVVAFEICSKIIYGIGVILVLILSMYILPDETVKKKMTFGLAAFLSVFATFTAVQMQAEMTAVVLAIFIFSCIVNGKKPLVILSGVLGSFFFFSKSVFVLLYFAILIGIVIYKPDINKKNIALSCVVMIISEAILLVLVKMIYPQEFVDMKNAADFQSTLFSAGSNVSLVTICTNFFHSFTQSCVAIPCLIVSCVCTICLLVKFIANREASRVVAVIFCWLIPIDIIVASNMYFIYHYFLLMIPGIICMLTYISENEISPIACLVSVVLSFIAVGICWLMKDGLQQWSFINYSTVLLVIVHVLIIVLVFSRVATLQKYKVWVSVMVITIGCFFWANYSSFFSPKHKNMVELAKQSEKVCKLSFPDDFGDEPVLFLDAGGVPFYVDAPSYSRYFFNLPMQRWNVGKQWDVQQNEYDKLMDYSGKYIVYTSWFGLDKYPELQDKISKEYSVLANSGIWTFSPDWNVFSLSEIPDIEQTVASSGAYIMIRNEHIDK